MKTTAIVDRGVSFLQDSREKEDTKKNDEDKRGADKKRDQDDGGAVILQRRFSTVRSLPVSKNGKPSRPIQSLSITSPPKGNNT